MSKTNYNKASRKPVETSEPIIGVDLAEQPDVTVEEEVGITKPKMGVVANCAKLNVRKKPHTNADVVTVINKGTIVDIDEKFNNKEFYKVSAATTGEAFFTGFCMKKYIEL